MKQETILFGLAAVFAGLATVEFVLAFVYSPALLAVAVPFGAAAYFLWYQASGRLRERAERGDASAYRGLGLGGLASGPRDDGPRERDDADARSRFAGGPDRGFGARARSGVDGRERRRTAGGPTAGAGATESRGRAGRSGRAPGVRREDGPSPTEAYRRLGLDPDADADAVRRAYRERVKSVHPDREGGDEDEFKRVNEAYEVLRERG
ncbi:J domain-containing protein [Halorussus halobius]|uniref:J domain-containing protein n=1 Tax=Halorussus halobius TaxID=1710537 RepID=UPI0010923049|nr:J domain-containing protein [Halorussus halobius]